MSCASEYVPQLRSHGYRMTQQRMAILHVLRHSGRHLSPREIYKRAKKDLPGITEPTVYRTLEFLSKNGLTHPSQAGQGHLTYEIVGDAHHHLTCRECGDEIKVGHDLFTGLYRELESTSRYSDIDSHVTFFGVCPECQKRTKGD